MGLKIYNEVEERSKLTAYISGEIDHHSAKSIRKEIDINVQKLNPSELYLDFSKVDFMDSSGIGLVMGRYKLLSERGGKVFIQNPPPLIKKVMLVAGINKLAKIVSIDVPVSEMQKAKESAQSCDCLMEQAKAAEINVYNNNDSQKNMSEKDLDKEVDCDAEEKNKNSKRDKA